MGNSCYSCAFALHSFSVFMALSLASASTSIIAPAAAFGAPRAAVQMSTVDYAKLMPGEGPFGFFDPLGFMSQGDMTEGRARYYREVEVKHGRVAMLGALGFLVGEQFHPLFGGNINVPSYVAYQETPLQTFWPTVVGIIGVFEFFSITSIEGSFEVKEFLPNGEKREAGEFMFDPLGFEPKGAAEFANMQSKELNNGRLAMIGMAGMVAQELVSGSKIF